MATISSTVRPQDSDGGFDRSHEPSEQRNCMLPRQLVANYGKLEEGRTDLESCESETIDVGTKIWRAQRANVHHAAGISASTGSHWLRLRSTRGPNWMRNYVRQRQPETPKLRVSRHL